MRNISSFFCLFFWLLCAEMPEPYQSLKLLPFDGRGWYVNQSQMEALFQQNKISIVVEVGSWLGQSTRHIASMLPAGGRVYAVDHWYGSPGWREDPNFNREYVDVYQSFLSNMVHAGFADVVIPVRMHSDEAARLLNVKPDLVYIDGHHSFEAVYEDLVAWYPFVKGHGILAGDDFQTSEGVYHAVIKFAEENNLRLFADHNFWRYYEDR